MEITSIDAQTALTRIKKIATPSRVLILSNCIPLFGVFFFGWSVFETVVLYWLESAVIGLYTVILFLLMPILPADRKGTPFNAKLFLIPFFIVHYGGFMAGHLFFITLFLGDSVRISFLGQVLEIFQKNSSIWWALLSLFLSHGYSFFVNSIFTKKYLEPWQKENLWPMLTKVYQRIFVMQFSVLLSAFGMILLRLPQPMIIVLVVIKTALDLKAHKKEHANDRARLKSETASPFV